MKCRFCQEIKPPEFFVKGQNCKCKACHAAARREYIARNPEKVKAQKKLYVASGKAAASTRVWRAANREHSTAYQREYYRTTYRRKIMLNNAKIRAEKAGVPCTITIDDIVIPEKCPALGIDLDGIGAGKGGFKQNSPSLDRLHPKLGYIPGNVAVISFRANRIKSDASVQEVEAVANWMRQAIKT